ncbi:hypothetical protein ACIRL2_19340 [Embleya sp. NPDC127516]
MDEVFDRLFRAGREAVLDGAVQAQEPPRVNGPRWGTSIVLRPEAAGTDRVHALAFEALAATGSGHWPTGARGSAHITVRAVEPHRTPIPADDPAAARYLSALRRAAARCPSIRFRVRGLTLTANSVMLCLGPEDGCADEFAGALARTLGADGWLEADHPRDVWYLTLVHFAGPIDRPEALVDWVAARRRLDLGGLDVDRAELVAWRFDGVRVVPDVLGAVGMRTPGAGAAPAPDGSGRGPHRDGR